MPLFSFKERDKTRAVQSFVLTVVNNNCPELEALHDGPRLEGRVARVVVVIVIPVDGKRILTGGAFTAVTKEFSTSGLSLVLNEPLALDDVILGFRWEGEMKYVRAEAKHLNPMGGGFFQLGFQMTEMMHVGDYPELETMSF